MEEKIKAEEKNVMREGAREIRKPPYL